MPDLLEKQQGKSEIIQSGAPKYVALAALLRERILRQELAVGDRLPSFAQLRAEFGATPTTAERIYGLLEQEGFAERRQGKGTFVANPARKRTGTFGFIGGTLFNQRKNPFNAHLMEGVQQAIEAQQHHLLYMGTDYSLNLNACEKVDGVLLCSIEDTDSVVRELPPHLPRVSLLNIGRDMPSVVTDDYEGAKIAVRHLLELGHCRIACLTEKLPSLARRRFAGYCDALMDANIEVDPRWARLAGTVPKALGTGHPYLEWARIQMSDWLREDWKQLNCTAILVQNEFAAIGVMQILQEAGIRIPGEVSVICFDGTEVCDVVVPRLTAVKLPLEEIGFKAAETLERQIQGEQLQSQIVVLPMSLRAGDSVAAPPYVVERRTGKQLNVDVDG